MLLLDLLTRLQKSPATIVLSDSDFELRLTQIKSCTNARLPSEDAKCNGDLASLGLTEEFTSSALQ